MDSSTYRRPGAFSPMPSASPVQPQSRAQHQRATSSESDSSGSSQLTAMSTGKRPPNAYPTRPSVLSSNSSNSSTTSLQSFHRPSIAHVANDIPSRRNSPLNPGGDIQRHKRQHSQGFFEPSLPTASLADHSNMPGLTASQIAAQAAMQQQYSNQHMRKRSQTVPSPQSPPEGNNGGRMKPPPIQAVPYQARRGSGTGGGQQYSNGLLGGPNVAATSAANAAFPRSAQLSPGLTNFEQLPEKDPKLKSERSKMKLFSKPKHIGITGYKDSDRKNPPLPSPNKAVSPGPSSLYKSVNASTASLVDPPMSVASSIYSSNNASTSTLVPSKTEGGEKAHRHNFLSRQKNKIKDKMDEHALALSSASSNSRPVDPNAPQSIYSFAPASPGPSTTSFAKSMSGLDLRHGGRALREKKKEEKAAIPLLEGRRSDVDRTDWAPSTYGASFHGPANMSTATLPASSHGADLAFGPLQGFGISNLSPEDAWDFLKAKLLIIFEGEELRMPVEDLNKLVSVHIQRCIRARAPSTLTEDLRDLLLTGFSSLEQTLHRIPDERLIPSLVDLWLLTFSTILPYISAVFLPLDLEFKGVGPLLSPAQAADFWGLTPDPTHAPTYPLDVRRLVLVAYRDHVILPRCDTLMAIFSRLSLSSLNVAVLHTDSPALPPPLPSPQHRPGTAGSLDPSFASFNSQSSTLLDDALSARSRAASNTSAPELPSFTAGRRPPRLVGGPVGAGEKVGSEQVTETVGRMLQCVSVLGSVQSGDAAQGKVEGLARELKLNWLGRGRTGRNRRGFVGSRVRTVL